MNLAIKPLQHFREIFNHFLKCYTYNVGIYAVSQYQLTHPFNKIVKSFKIELSKLLDIVSTQLLNSLNILFSLYLIFGVLYLVIILKYKLCIMT